MTDPSLLDTPDKMESSDGAPGPCVIVGGGLAGGLAALALVEAGRGREVVLVERDQRLGGNHTWSFHETDLSAGERALVAPLVAHAWPSQEVRFPGRARALDAGYATVTAARFAEEVAARLARAGARLVLGRGVSSVGATQVTLDGGEVLAGAAVLDARGPTGGGGGRSRAGYQKFLGLELELAGDGPWTRPVVMDATVPQRDGYRFFYVLPFGPRHVLVEDTVYSGSPELDAAAYEQRVLAYVAGCGASVRRVVRREAGVLPLPYGPPDAPADERGPVQIGYRGGFFHPLTGSSLPLAARVARAVASARGLEGMRAAVRAIDEVLRPQRRFQRRLGRLLFEAVREDHRWTVFERFYRLPAPTIARFYASRSTLADRLRILVGRPPKGIAWRRVLVPAPAEGT
jgi:lycopene beta-cyclase